MFVLPPYCEPDGSTSLESQLPATCFAFAAMVTLAANPKSPIVPWVM